MSSLQIKRSSEIFENNDKAVEYLKEIKTSLIDGEILLCRYRANGKIETLIATACVESDGNKHISYVNSLTEVVPGGETVQIQVGDGLVQEEDGTVKVLVDSKVTNFLSVDGNGMKVVDMNANVTKTTKDIIVMGGPLATDAVKKVIGDKDSSNNPYIKTGTNVQDLLEKLFCEEIYPTNIKYVDGNVSASIKQPIVTFSKTATTLEVGTYISASTISFNGNSVATLSSSTVSGLDYGYSSLNDNVKDSSDNKIVKNPNTGYVAANATKMICEYSGFTETEFSGDTGTTVFEKTNINLGQVMDGDNIIKVSISGQPIYYSIDGIGEVYPCSNIGNTNGDLRTKKIEAQTNKTTDVPRNSTTKTIVGVRYGFYGMLNETEKETFGYTSNEIRKLKSLTKKGTFNIKGESVAMVVIAIPNSWNAEIYEIRDAEQMNSNLFGSTTGYDNENYDATNHPNGVRTISVEGLNSYQGSDYKVYTFSPNSSIEINQTVTFK